jgi:hypothetical protein
LPRHGDPNRALLYLNKACSGDKVEETMFILRSQCHLKLGHYHSADQVTKTGYIAMSTSKFTTVKMSKCHIFYYFAFI